MDYSYKLVTRKIKEKACKVRRHKKAAGKYEHPVLRYRCSGFTLACRPLLYGKTRVFARRADDATRLLEKRQGQPQTLPPAKMPGTAASFRKDSEDLHGEKTASRTGSARKTIPGNSYAKAMPENSFNAEKAEQAPARVLPKRQEEKTKAEGDAAGISDSRKEKAQRFKEKLRRPALSLFEPAITEEEKQEEALRQLINKDGYYSEIFPEDYGNDYTHREKKKLDLRLVAVLSVFVIIGFYLIISNVLRLL